MTEDKWFFGDASGGPTAAPGTLRITLPWPPKELSPNARVNWRTRAKKTKKYKADCWVLFLQRHRQIRGRWKFKITFCRPDRRSMDLDNAINSIKALQDALSIETGVNDKHFDCQYAFGEPVKHGAVLVDVYMEVPIFSEAFKSQAKEPESSPANAQRGGVPGGSSRPRRGGGSPAPILPDDNKEADET